MSHAELRDEANAEAGRDHGLDPILTLTAVDLTRLNAALVAGLAEIISIFAVDPKQIILTGNVLDFDRIFLAEAVADRKSNNKAFAIQRMYVHPRVERPRLCHNGEVELSFQQHFGELTWYSLNQGQLNSWIPQTELIEEGHESQRSDGAHYADRQG